MKPSGRSYRLFRDTPSSFLERVIYNYITTHRSIRELATYYHVPRSTMASWLKKAEDLVSYELYSQYKAVASMHRRAQCMRWNGQEEYFKTNEDGPYD